MRASRRMARYRKNKPVGFLAILVVSIGNKIIWIKRKMSFRNQETPKDGGRGR